MAQQQKRDGHVLRNGVALEFSPYADAHVVSFSYNSGPRLMLLNEDGRPDHITSRAEAIRVYRALSRRLGCGGELPPGYERRSRRG